MRKTNQGKNNFGKKLEIISDHVEVANTISNYFSNVVKIPEKFVTDKLPQSLSRYRTLNAILKYKNTQACM